MRYILIGFTFLFISIVSGQQNYNKFSFDGNLGFTNVIGPFAEGYSSNYLTFGHVDGGFRYMFTGKVGVKLDFGFDLIKNDETRLSEDPIPDQIPSVEFKTHYFRTDLQVVLNLGRMIKVENISTKLGCLMHFGFGISSLKNSTNSVWFSKYRGQSIDDMMNFMIGITPQFMVNNKLALNADFSVVSNVWQSKTWDFTEDYYTDKSQGKLFNLSLGVSYYFGKSAKHIDWSFANKELDVNSNGVAELDTDGDSVPDSKDDCPNRAGDLANGCLSSDIDNDGVINNEDACPEIAGIVKNSGCPEINMEVKKILHQAQTGVKFLKHGIEMAPRFQEILDPIVQVLNDHPEYLLELKGHTDNLGEKESLKSLSLDRAEIVKAFLVENGITESRIRTIGLGDSVPLTPNDNPQGREQNRRVEFKIKFK